MKQTAIIQTIQDLLLEYNYVTIPQLGGFVSKYQAAQIIDDKNIIAAPSRKISFNANLKDDDGLLINTLAKKEGLSIEEAKQLVKNFVKDSFISLDEGKKLVLEKIGVLKFNQQLNIEFVVDVNENYNPHSYGMVDVVCNVINPNEIVIKKNKQFFTRRTLKRVAVIIPFMIVGTMLSVYLNQINFFSAQFYNQATIIPALFENNNNKEESTVKEKSIAEQIEEKTKQKNALAYREPKKEVVESVEMIKEAKPEIQKEDIAEIKLTTESKIIEEENNSKEAVKKIVAVKIKSKKYQLIAGSFKSEDNAIRLSKKIQKKNFNSEVVKLGNRYRVIAASFEQKSAAMKVKRSLKKEKISTWINTLK